MSTKEDFKLLHLWMQEKHLLFVSRTDGAYTTSTVSQADLLDLITAAKAQGARESLVHAGTVELEGVKTVKFTEQVGHGTSLRPGTRLFALGKRK